LPDELGAVTHRAMAVPASRRGVLPHAQRQELGEHHRGGTPDLFAVHVEKRDFDVDQRAVALEGAALDANRRLILEQRHRHFEQAVHLAGCRDEARARVGSSDHGLQPEPADRNVQRRESPEHLNVGGDDADFLDGFTDGGVLEALAGVDRAAWECHLAGVVTQRAAANRQQHVRLIVHGIEQHQRGGLAEAVWHAVGIPPDPRARCEAELGVEAGQRRLQRRPDPCRQVDHRNSLTARVALCRHVPAHAFRVAGTWASAYNDRMISPRAPRDGDRSRKAPLPGSCRAIGAQLAATRDTRQISVEAVASKLLLSKGQILGLEQGDPSPFYSVDYFLRGLRKYMSFMGLPAGLLVIDDDEEEGGLRLMLADMAPTRATPFRTPPGARLLAAAAVAIITIGGAAYAVSRVAWRAPAASGPDDTVSLATTAPLPAQPLRSAAEQRSTVASQPAPVAATGGDPAATVRVTVGKPTWVFVRYPDNRVVERRLEAGEELELGPLPVYLALGTADSVEVRVENRPVALGPYIRDGQVRFTQPELARLVP
jgi:cytoskeletal protein RodZ